MKLSQTSLSLIKDTLQKAVSRYLNNNRQTIVTDIHLQPNPNSGELSIFDDEDEELATATIEEWCGHNGNDFYEKIESILTSILTEMKSQGAFEKLFILKPYSFVLVDDEKETVADLLLIDDDTLFINDELLKGLDKELDAFLKDLLEK